MESGGDTWTIGPAESWLVQALLYFATGLLPAYLIITAIELVQTIAVSASTLIVGGLFAVLLIITFARIFRVVVVSPTHWVFTEFTRIVHSIGLCIATLSAILGLEVLIRLGATAGTAFPFLVITCLSGTFLLSSRGAINSDDQTLTYHTIREYEISLESVRKVKQFTIGRRTYLWLSFQTADGTSVHRLLLIPTNLLTRIESSNNSLLSPLRTTETDNGTRRTVLLAGLLLFGCLFGGFTAIIYLANGSGSLLEAFRISVILFGVPFALFLVAHFTNLLAHTSAK